MAGIYDEMRSRALSVTRDDLAPGAGDAPVHGVVMDMAYPEGTATLVGLADGTTSLYHSGGGGIIGGGEHRQVAEATERWVATGAELADELEPANECPLPANPGAVQLIVLTPDGRLSATADEEELGAGGHPLSPLFLTGHDVINELRLLDEAAG